MSDDVGTVRWFGASWGAPICDPRTKIEVPIDRLCLNCGGGFFEHSRGVSTAASFSISEEGRVYYHLGCFLRNLGIDTVEEVVDGNVS